MYFAVAAQHVIILGEKESFLIVYALCNSRVILPIPSKNRPKLCEDFVASQGGADNAGQEGPLGSTGKIAGRPKGGFAKQSAESADAGLRQKTAKLWPVFN